MTDHKSEPQGYKQNLIPAEYASEILKEAIRMQALKDQIVQKQQYCTLQELKEIAEEFNVSGEIVQDATRIVLAHREKQELERQQQKRDRQARCYQRKATLRRYTRRAIVGGLAGVSIALIVLLLKNIIFGFRPMDLTQPIVPDPPTSISP
jgi:Zn-dependent peptidase ImmA (M78 family)